MNDQKECVKGQTESERILKALDYKLDMLSYTAAIIITKVTFLGGFEKLPSDPKDSEKPAQGGNFIGELDVRIERLQRLIEGYEAILYNLEKLA